MNSATVANGTTIQPQEVRQRALLHLRNRWAEIPAVMKDMKTWDRQDATDYLHENLLMSLWQRH